MDRWWSEFFRYNNLLNPPFPEDIEWTYTNKYAGTKTTSDWCKKCIQESGLAGILTIAEVKEVVFVTDMATVPNTQPSWLGTQQGSKIIVLDHDWMPGYMLPGVILHEAMHMWQTKNDLMHDTGKTELQAWTISQLFEWRYCVLNDKTPQNFFKDSRFGAYGLL